MLIMQYFLKEGRNPQGPTKQRQTTTDILVYFSHVPFLCKCIFLMFLFLMFRFCIVVSILCI